MADETDWELVWKVNADALRASGGFGMAYITWQAYSPDWFFFGFIAACCAMGGLICIGKALFHLVRLLPRIGKRVKFKTKGVDLKADEMARLSDLKKRGLMK
ncbi:hypothetical protein [uncultured Tateyamaria sp.]|uniref:hypothetical protein n=1 Tax=uncultured Tateyamaria sp. TaxID=455651 RepID=UPI00261647B3|nr:hypothetical protein [uncultured Tateyamaria sp.]